MSREVLRSAPMHHYNRYLRRTYYYIDQDLENGQVIRVSVLAQHNDDEREDDDGLVSVLCGIPVHLIDPLSNGETRSDYCSTKT